MASQNLPGADVRSALSRAETLRVATKDADISALVPELSALTVSIGINECSRGERRMLAAARTFGLPRADQTA